MTKAMTSLAKSKENEDEADDKRKKDRTEISPKFTPKLIMKGNDSVDDVRLIP